MPFGDGVRIGEPIRWQRVVDAITTYYPEYLFLIDDPEESQEGKPLAVDDQSLPITNYPSLAVFVAMICPPNMTVRPLSIGSMDWNEAGTVSGIGPYFEFSAKQPPVAPGTFVDMESDVYEGGSSASDAVNDINEQIDAYRLANPNTRIIGTLVASYTDNDDPDTPSQAICKLAGRNMA